MNRACQPELLDSLPHDHPDAAHNRRDLRIINRVLRNRRWFEATLPTIMRDGECALELGAGMGELARGLHERAIPVDGLDLWPRPQAWPQERKWHVADLRRFEGYDSYAVIIGNLIFHQFDDAELAALGSKIRRSARAILACEPERSRVSQLVFAGVAPLFGANHITLHDARVSIKAGFRGDELPHALGLDDGSWSCSCTTSALGVNRMIAVRAP